MADFETLLREAFAPVDPPAELEARLEERLTTLVDAAAEELEGWELTTMRDPRNWGPTIAAAAVGGTAAVGLVLVRTQRRRHKRRAVRTTCSSWRRTRCATSRAKPTKIIDEGRRRLVIRCGPLDGVGTPTMADLRDLADEDLMHLVARSDAARLRGRLRAPLRRRLLARLPDGRQARRGRGRRPGGLPQPLALRGPLRPGPRHACAPGCSASCTTAPSTPCARSTVHEKRRTGDEDIAERLEAPERTDVEAARRDEARTVRAALDTLPAEQCQVIELAYFGGFSHSEIAEMLEDADRNHQGPHASGP